MRAVDDTTAFTPPPRMESRKMGSVSFVLWKVRFAASQPEGSQVVTSAKMAPSETHIVL